MLQGEAGIWVSRAVDLAGYDFNVEAASVRVAERARRSVFGRPALALEDPLETDWDLGRLLDEQRLARLRAELRRAARRLRGGPSESSLKAVFARRGLRFCHSRDGFQAKVGGESDLIGCQAEVLPRWAWQLLHRLEERQRAT
ncbi:unnamed protein product [Symbiodinium sp. CCMP2592]|nr:unnamed protein product [Symbiodinium sp. CCMP2592]